MRYFFLLTIAFLSGCDNTTTTTTTHEQVIAPKSLTFAHGESVKTLSITHTCTCPFTWYVTVLNPNAVLKDTIGTGDNTAVPFTIDRSKLTVDTLIDAIAIHSAYGTDTIQITVLK
jgi:hypothetical protein